VVIVIALVAGLCYSSYRAYTNATKARDYDRVEGERDLYQEKLAKQQKTLREQFSETLGDSLGSSFADAQAAATARNYGLALRELDKIQPWLQLGESTDADLSRVQAAFEEAHKALDKLSSDAPQKVEALIEAAQELAPEKKL
jgi:uncharacterized membrane-anchored protein YhcB (DUF1043 family)